MFSIDFIFPRLVTLREVDCVGGNVCLVKTNLFLAGLYFLKIIWPR